MNWLPTLFNSWLNPLINPPSSSREIGSDELSTILARHHDWWLSRKTTSPIGARADLSYANLRGRDLRGVDLRGANLQGASLHEAQLRGADLEEADFTGVQGLLPDQLGDTNLQRAQMPDGFKFDGLERVDQLSKNAGVLFLSMLLGCVYSWLTVYSATDIALLTNSGTSKLPIIQVAVPIVGFYWVAPIILLGIYVYFHLYLQRLWESMATLPAIFPNGTSLDRKIYPWLMSGLVKRHFKHLRRVRPPLTWIQELLSLFLGWWIVPFTLLFFWFFYLLRHDWIGTTLHLVVFTVALWVCVMTLRLARATLRGEQRELELWNSPWRQFRFYKRAGAAIGAGVCLTVLSWGCINGINPEYVQTAATETMMFQFMNTLKDEDDEQRWKAFDNFIESARFELGTMNMVSRFEAEKVRLQGEVGKSPRLSSKLTFAQIRIPQLVEPLGRTTFANLSFADVSTKPENWIGKPVMLTMLSDEKISVSQIESVKGANLLGADLNYCVAIKAFLTRANLGGAQMQRANFMGAQMQETLLMASNLIEANLSSAQMQGANLMMADLRGATLLQTDLRGANLGNAQMQDAFLSDAQLQKSLLIYAQMQRSDLSYAQLQGADLSGANLQDADMTDAQLQGADLLRAKNLTWEQVRTTEWDTKTKFPPHIVQAIHNDDMAFFAHYTRLRLGKEPQAYDQRQFDNPFLFDLKQMERWFQRASVKQVEEARSFRF